MLKRANGSHLFQVWELSKSHISECPQLHIFALANVLKRPIIVYSDHEGNDVRGIYLPLLWKDVAGRSLNGGLSNTNRCLSQCRGAGSFEPTGAWLLRWQKKILSLSDFPGRFLLQGPHDCFAYSTRFTLWSRATRPFHHPRGGTTRPRWRS